MRKVFVCFACILIALLFICAHADYTSGDFTYDLDFINTSSGSLCVAIIKGYVGPTDTDIVVPDTIDSYPVRFIEGGAFLDVENQRIILPENIQAFSYKTTIVTFNVYDSEHVKIVVPSLTGTTAANLIKHADHDSSFNGTMISQSEPDFAVSVEEVDNQKTLTVMRYLGTDSQVVIPDEIDGIPVTTLNGNTFNDFNAVTSLTLSRNLTVIQSGTLDVCTGLTEITFPASMTTLSGSTNWLEGITRIIPDEDVVSLPSRLLDNCAQGTTFLVQYNSQLANSLLSRGFTVRYKPHSFTSISAPKNLELELGKGVNYEFTLEPNIPLEDFDQPQVAFSSSDEKVLYVDPMTGRIRAVGAGTAKVFIQDKGDSFVNAVTVVNVTDSTRKRLVANISALATGSGSNGTLHVSFGARGGKGPYTFTISKKKNGTELSKVTRTVNPDASGVVSLSDTMSVPDDTNYTNTMYSFGFDVVDASGDTSYGVATCIWVIDSYVNNKPVYKKKVIVSNPYEKLLTHLYLDDTLIGLQVGQSQKLQTIYSPSDTLPNLAWISSDYAVADVDENGQVTAMSPGMATISACAVDGSGLKASCKVNCYAVPVRSIEIEALAVDNTTQTQQLIGHVVPENADFTGIIWDSLYKDIATIDENGLITWLQPGNTTITACSNQGTSWCNYYPIHWDGVMAESVELTIDPDCPQRLLVHLTPENVSVKDVELKPSDVTMLEITDEGFLHFFKDGTCTVRARTLDGTDLTAQIEVSGTVVHDHILRYNEPGVLAADGKNGHSAIKHCAICDEAYPAVTIPLSKCITLPTSLTTIDAEAFSGLKSIMQVIVPTGVTTIGSHAFSNCDALLLVSIPESVTDIADDAFSGCPEISLLVKEGSAAQGFAKRNHLSWFPID